ncbi:MAG: PAS domain S-box protein [Hyphomicrobiaceae bacterium]
MDSLPGTICKLALTGQGQLKLLYSSKDLAANYGLKGADLSSDITPILKIILGEDAVKIRMAIERSARELTPLDLEFKIQHPCNGEVWAEGRSMPKRESDGSTVWHGFLHNVTARKRLEEKSESQALLRNLMLDVSREMLHPRIDHRKLGENILKMINEKLGLDLGFNYRIVDGTLQLQACLPLPEELEKSAQKLSLGEAVCGTVASQGKAIIANEQRIATDEICAFLRAAGAKSFACFPLVDLGGQIKGTFSVGSRNAHSFSSDEIEVLGMVSNYLALAWERLEVAQQAADESLRLRLALEVAELGLFEHDQRTDKFETSELFRKVANRPEASKINLEDLLMTLRPNEQESIRANVAKAHAPEGDGIHRAEYRFVRLDGTIRYISVSAQTRFKGIGPDRHPIKTIGAIADITERKVEEQRRLALMEDLAASRADAMHQKMLFQSIFESAPDAILLTDLSCKITHINPAFTRVLGYDPKELVAEHTAPLYANESERNLVARIAAGYQDNPLMPAHPLEFRRKDGSVLLGVMTGAVLRAPSGEAAGYVGIIRDVSAEFKREEAMQETRRLEAVGRLAGGIAHDFNNLLTVISGNLQLIKAMPNDVQLLHYFQEAFRAIELGARLNNSLMTFARQRRLEQAPTDLSLLAEELIDLLRRSIGDDILIETDLASGLPAVMLDKAEMETALLNLALNARDAMLSGGKLTIVTKLIDAAAMGALLTSNEGVQLIVRDTGEGMTPETQRRAFDPFFTTKDVGKGSGLGLAIVHGFVRQSGGTITLDSAVGVGTTVSMTFPAVAGRATSVGKSLFDGVDVPKAGGETVLVVEDNASVRRVTVSQLEALGYRTVQAMDGPSALEVFHAVGDGKIDLVLTDISMPGGMSGIELLKRIREASPTQRALLTTGYPIMPPDQSVVPGLMLSILRKPYALGDLARMTRQAIVGRT